MLKNMVLCAFLCISTLVNVAYGMEHKSLDREELFTVTVNGITCQLPNYRNTVKKTCIPLHSLLNKNVPSNNNIGIAIDVIKSKDFPKELGSNNSKSAHTFYLFMFNLINGIEVSEDFSKWRMIKAFNYLRENQNMLLSILQIVNPNIKGFKYYRNNDERSSDEGDSSSSSDSDRDESSSDEDTDNLSYLKKIFLGNKEISFLQLIKERFPEVIFKKTLNNMLFLQAIKNAFCTLSNQNTITIECRPRATPPGLPTAQDQ